MLLPWPYPCTCILERRLLVHAFYSLKTTWCAVCSGILQTKSETASEYLQSEVQTIEAKIAWIRGRHTLRQNILFSPCILNCSCEYFLYWATYRPCIIRHRFHKLLRITIMEMCVICQHFGSYLLCYRHKQWHTYCSKSKLLTAVSCFVDTSVHPTSNNNGVRLLPLFLTDRSHNS